MGYIEQTDVGNVYTTDINDWFATLSNLNRECKNYIDSEIRYKEILAEHDKQIRAEVIEEFLNEVEEWGSYCVFHRYDDFCEMHKIMKKVAEQLKEQK